MPLLPSSGKKTKNKKKSCLWFGLRCTSVINQAWALVPERLPREAHQSFKHKYIGHRPWFHLVCFLNLFSFFDKCCNPILPRPLWQQHRHLLRGPWQPAVSRRVEAVCSCSEYSATLCQKKPGFLMLPSPSLSSPRRVCTGLGDVLSAC